MSAILTTVVFAVALWVFVMMVLAACASVIVTGAVVVVFPAQVILWCFSVPGRSYLICGLSGLWEDFCHETDAWLVPAWFVSIASFGALAAVLYNCKLTMDWSVATLGQPAYMPTCVVVGLLLGGIACVVTFIATLDW